MIRIQRTDCPAVLVGKTSDGTHYNKAEVVAALWKMQHGKCCYCERSLPEQGHLKAVEHFKPKSIFPVLRNEWSNLLLACSQCNGHKGNQFPVNANTGLPAILDPSDPAIDPEDHLDFDFDPIEWMDGFAVIMAKGGSDLGQETIRTVRLDDIFYTRLRKKKHRRVINVSYLSLIEAIEGGDPDEIAAQRASFELLMAPNKPHAALARAFARFKKLDEPPVAVRIPKG